MKASNYSFDSTRNTYSRTDIKINNLVNKALECIEEIKAFYTSNDNLSDSEQELLKLAISAGDCLREVVG